MTKYCLPIGACGECDKARRGKRRTKCAKALALEKDCHGGAKRKSCDTCFKNKRAWWKCGECTRLRANLSEHPVHTPRRRGSKRPTPDATAVRDTAVPAKRPRPCMPSPAELHVTRVPNPETGGGSAHAVADCSACTLNENGAREFCAGCMERDFLADGEKMRWNDTCDGGGIATVLGGTAWSLLGRGPRAGRNRRHGVLTSTRPLRPFTAAAIAARAFAVERAPSARSTHW